MTEEKLPSSSFNEGKMTDEYIRVEIMSGLSTS